MKAIADSAVPVIAAVDGLAAAAGCQLVSACDIAVCTERSTFSTPGYDRFLQSQRQEKKFFFILSSSQRHSDHSNFFKVVAKQTHKHSFPAGESLPIKENHEKAMIKISFSTF